jgi:hypothetical protein
MYCQSHIDSCECRNEFMVSIWRVRAAASHSLFADEWHGSQIKAVHMSCQSVD